MTVINNDARDQYTATNGQTIFNYTFEISDQDNIQVFQRAAGSDPDDVADLLTLTTDYTVTGVGVNTGGTIVLVSGATLNDIITLQGNSPPVRSTAFTPGGVIQAANLNTEFDDEILIYQTILGRLNFLVPAYPKSAVVQDFDIVLPILGSDQTWVMNTANDEIVAADFPSDGAANKLDTYVTLTDETAHEPNSFPLSAIGNGIMVNRTGTTDIVTRILTGTVNQLDVANGDGQSANPTISIADNAILPGVEGLGIPTGTTAERPVAPSTVSLRYNSDLQQFEFYDGGWFQLEDSSDIATLLALLASHVAGEGASLIGLEGSGTVQDLAEVPFIIKTANTAAPNAQALGALASGFLTSTTVTGVVASRSLAGTANQIDISNTTGAGNPAFSLSSTLDFPGTFTVQNTVDINAIIDDDTMATATATNLPTAESVVAYIASVVGGAAGGVAGNIQYNDAGGFGGDANFNTDGAGNIDITGSLSVDNIDINGNVISSTNVNGDIVLTPNGTGNVEISSYLDMTTHLISNVVDPVSAQDAATKAYVDAIAAAFNNVFAARLASTGALTVTYDNGSSGVGATLTNAGVQAALELDGLAAVAGNLVLIKDQASTLQNGYYTVTNIGSGATNWVLTRSTRYDAPSEIEPGDLFVITEGNTQDHTSWIQTATVTAVGVDPITFSQYSVALPIPISQGGTGATNAADARTNLGLGTMAVQNANAVAITGGTITGLTNLEVDNIQIDGDSIIHIADTNNKIVFGTDTQSYETGGTSRLDITDAGVRLGAANSRVTTILDEDDMASDSATALATQQSIKAYVDNYSSNVSQSNIIIGGNFDSNPWQRQVSFTNPSNGTYTADRFSIARSDDSQFNILKTADAPTITETGIYSASCFHLDVTTADGTIGAAQYCAVRYNVEGYDIQAAGFGQASAKQITLSFWHKHTVTGTYCVGFSNSGNNRSYIAEYTQAVADTWEKATITITADTSGTWLYTNGLGLSLWFVVAAGTDWQNTANQWNATLDFASASQVNGLSNAANNFKLQLIKLEINSVATQYPNELAANILYKSQRYYFKTYSQGTYPAAATTAGCIAATSSGTAGTGGGQNGVNMTVPFPVTMRTAPSCTIYNTGTGTSGEFQSQSGGASIAGATGYIGDYKTSAINTGACADQTIYTTQVVADAEL